MEPKTNLNNTQRKMLDTVFSQRIEKKVKLFNERRSDERKKLERAELAKAEKSKDVKEAVKFYKSFYALKKKLSDQGVELSTNYDGAVKVELGGRYGTNTKPFALQAFDEESRKLSEKINESTTEVRARIYGMDTSYEEVDKELKGMFDFLDK